MKKYIYYSKKVRCRIRYVKYMRHFELQIQERRLLWFWVNVWKWMSIKEGFWGESDRHPILRSSYESGNSCEAWKTGTLDIRDRIKKFFEEYYLEKNREVSSIKRIKSL